MVDPDMQALVYEIGSSYTKAGFSGDDAPRAVFPTVVGRPKQPGIYLELQENNTISKGVMVGMDAKDCFVGDEAQAKRGILNINRPINNGMPTDWNDYEKVLHQIPYNELKVAPEEHPIMIIQPPYLPKKKRSIITFIMFETFNVPAYSLEVDAALSIHPFGKETGVICDLGYNFTRSVAVFHGSPIPGTAVYENYGAYDIENRFKKETMAYETDEETIEDKRNYLEYNTMGYGQELKKVMRTAMDYEKEIINFTPIVEDYTYYKAGYRRSREAKINIGKEALVLETYFNPQLFGLNYTGITKMIKQTIKMAPSDLQEELKKSIGVVGSFSQFPNFCARLQKELDKDEKNKGYCIMNKYYYSEEEKRPLSPAFQFEFDSLFHSWIGGSIVSSLSTYQNSWMTKDEYDEYGMSLINRKCPNTLLKFPQSGVCWSMDNHKFLSKPNQLLMIFFIWCNMQEESAIYCIPTEVMFIIMEFYPLNDYKIEEKYPEDENWKYF